MPELCIHVYLCTCTHVHVSEFYNARFYNARDIYTYHVGWSVATTIENVQSNVLSRYIVQVSQQKCSCMHIYHN